MKSGPGSVSDWLLQMVIEADGFTPKANQIEVIAEYCAYMILYLVVFRTQYANSVSRLVYNPPMFSCVFVWLTSHKQPTFIPWNRLRRLYPSVDHDTRPWHQCWRLRSKWSMDGFTGWGCWENILRRNPSVFTIGFSVFDRICLSSSSFRKIPRGFVFFSMCVCVCMCVYIYIYVYTLCINICYVLWTHTSIEDHINRIGS